MRKEFDLELQYERACRSLDNFGISENQGLSIPSERTIHDSLTPLMRLYLDERADIGIEDALVISPYIHDSLSMTNLLAKGGVKLEGNPTWENHTRGKYMWDVVHPEHHNGGKNRRGWSVSVLLQDTLNPLRPIERANMFNEPGLVHPAKTAGQQMRAIKREHKTFKRYGIDIEPITAPQYTLAKLGRIAMLDQTQHIESRKMPANSKELFSGKYTRDVAQELSTITRFVQYPRVNLNNSPHCPDSSNMMAREFIYPTWSMTRRQNIGVRRVMNIPLDV